MVGASGPVHNSVCSESSPWSETMKNKSKSQPKSKAAIKAGLKVKSALKAGGLGVTN
jgi:hypothetical protein